ncbi:filamentous hemagglutinin N-terminal domain-containing protein [Tolypothrix sp. VBCCA 56010]|uniref:two-partner secretion domain-containing protein n=1 Tax=Tolypothrix sp. VBCCA 56010 TaxID=3137731 RepID=UPI003D7E8F01
MTRWLCCGRFVARESWLMVGGAICLAVSQTLAFSTNSAVAQITPDGTLPNNSSVKLEGSTFNITGGTQAGSNLFHSFGQFSVPTGGTAFFNNAVDIQNIIGRVTGGSISNIDGLIRANGAANLFLINPSGIVFGPNASLNVGGSFLASTASSLKFADGFEFSATARQSTPLLTISVPIGLQFGANPGSIQSQSVATNSNGESVGLQVEPGKTLALVGGDVRLDGGLLQAANGRVELAGVAAWGTVNLQVNNNNFSLTFPVDIPTADVSLLNAAKVDVTGNGAGSVGITARSIDISGGSKISAGLNKEAGIASVPGNITLNATGVVTIDQLSRITNMSALGTTANAGNISIQAGDIFVDNRATVPDGNEIFAALDTSSNGQGRAGNVSLSATGKITLIGQDANIQDKVISTYGSQGLGGGGDISLSAAGSILLSNAYLLAGSNTANGGNISLIGNNVSIADNSSLITGTGGGNAGNITIKSPGDVSIKRSLVSTNVGSDITVNAGDINISGRSVSVTEGAELTARLSRGSGKAGNISINAVDKVEISGNDPFDGIDGMGGDRAGDFQNTVLTTRTQENAIGNAGNISIQAGEIFVDSRASVPDGKERPTTLDTTSNGQGRGGNVSLSATGKITLIGEDANVLDKVIYTYNEQGLGGGDISLSAGDSISLENAYLQAGGGKANGGSISLFANNSISIADNSSLISGTGGGKAGDITVKSAGNVSIQNSLLVSAVGGELAGQAKGGDINISGQSVFVTDGSELTAQSSKGGGNSGNINIDAKDTVEISGKEPILSPPRQDRSGTYFYTTLTTLSDEMARGTAGNININTGKLRVLDGAVIAADTRSDFRGGDIMVNAKVVELSNGGQILTTARSRGNAGNILLKVGDGIVLSGTNPNYAEEPPKYNRRVEAVSASSGLFANTEAGSSGNGGTIEINSTNLSINNGAGIGINSNGQGSAGGFLNIKAGDSIALTDGLITSGLGSQAIGQGGEINLTAGELSLTDGAKVVASTSGQGNAGRINAQVKDRVTLTNNSQIQSTVESGAVGQGGEIKLNAGELSLTDGAIVASTSGQGNAGNINIDAPNGSVSISDSSGLLTQTSSDTGKGGIIAVTTKAFEISNNATLNATTNSASDGGSVIINASTFDAVSGSKLQTTTSGSGNAGNIRVKVGDRFSLSGTGTGLFANTAPGSSGNGGSIEINSTNLSINNGASIGINSSGQGSAGRFLNINARDSIALTDGFITSGLGSQAIGQGGTINLTAGSSLSLTDGAKVVASTSGQGNAGRINAQVKDRVTLTNNSQIQSSVESTATGNGTQISISGRSLSLNNNSQITAQSQGTGNAGNINIDASTFDAVSGGKLLTTTSGSGNAGNITVNLSDRFRVSGADTGLFANTEVGSSGTGGSIFIDPRTVLIENGAGVSVDSRGTGIGGNIQIQADSLKLDNRAFLSAETASTQGGNITIQNEGLLLLRRNSQISTNAGDGQGGGDGGNITINSPNGFIVAVPNENSDITANAVTGSGGRVQINASGVFGTQFREEENPQTSDITASSQFGVNGTVEINTPDIDPNSGLINLPTVPVDTKVASGCTAGASQNQSRFVVTGRGGLPLNPREAFNNNDTVRVDWVTLNPSSDNRRSQTVTKPTIPTPAPIVEATGWVINDKGEVLLTASPPAGTPHSSWQTPTTCGAPKSAVEH